jgi:hypothetical protein
MMLLPPAGVPIPKFAIPFGSLRCELRNQRDTSHFDDSSVALDLKFLCEFAATVGGTSNPPHWWNAASYAKGVRP